MKFLLLQTLRLASQATSLYTREAHYRPTVHLKGVTHYTLQGKACEKEYEQMPVLLLFFRQVKPALWKPPFRVAFLIHRILSFLAEVGQTEVRRGLALALLAHTGDDQHDDGDDIREHLEQLLVAHAEILYVVVHDVESAEQERAEDAEIRSPHGENDQRDRQPAAVAERIVRPHAAGIVHDVVQTAQPRNHAADAGGEVLIPPDVDTGGIRRGGVLADGAEMQTDTRAAQHICRDQRDDDGDIGKKAVRQEDRAEPAELVRKRQLRAEAVAGGSQADRGSAAAGELGKRTAEEVAHTDAERGERKTGDVLIGAERDREEAVDQPHQK